MGSHKNHLQSFFDNKLGSKRPQPQSQWTLQIGRSERAAMEWRSELQLAAYQIHQQFPEGVNLYVDGSYASQVMVQAFYWAQIPFKPIVVRFKKDLNIHSFSTAVFFLEQFSREYEVVDFDLEKILTSQAIVQMGAQYGSHRLEQLIAINVWQYMAAHQRSLVLPFGIPEFVNQEDGWKVCEMESDFAVLHFQKQHEVSGVPLFFRWSPEMLVSFLKDPIVKSLVSNQLATKAWSAELLIQVAGNYYKIFGKLDFKGFERLSFEQKKLEQILWEREKFRPAKVEILYTDFLKNLEFQPQSQSSTQPRLKHG